MNCRRIIRRTRVRLHPAPRHAAWRCAAGWSALMVCLIVAAGCESSNSSGMSNGTSNVADNSAGPRTTSGIDDDVLNRLEEEFPVGPQAARTINYRVDWMSKRGGNGVKMMRIQGDSIFTLDRYNILSRIHRDTGELLWRTAVESELTEVISINFSPAANQVFVAVGASLVVLAADTGSLTSRQRLDKIINVQSTIAGPYLLYGSRDGDLVWHRFDIGHPSRSYNIAQSVQVPPLLTENVIVAVGNDGELFVLDFGSAQSLWRRRLDDPVDAQPEVGAGVVYVAGRDQFIRAFDLANGRQYWHYITPAKLTSSPTLIGDRVYQDVPGSGVVALEALPIDKIGGVELWTVVGATGRVITKYQEKLLTWDSANRSMSVIDDNAGMLITNIPLPDVKFLTAIGRANGVLYAASEDGRVMRLSPAN